MTDDSLRPPASLDFPDLVAGLSDVERFRITAEDVDRFAELSGDFSPIHMSEDFARAKGFSGRVVHGALLIAHLSRLIGMKLPGQRAVWTGINFSFRRPIAVGDEVELRLDICDVSHATRLLGVSVRAEVAGRRVADGTAEVFVLP